MMIGFVIRFVPLLVADMMVAADLTLIGAVNLRKCCERELVASKRPPALATVMRNMK
jgi:hypothetical protein